MARSLESTLADQLAIRAIVAGCRCIVQVATDGLIDLDADTATGRWQIAETIFTKDGRAAINLGHYADRYRRDADGVWRFARREFSSRYFGAPDLSAEPNPPAGWKATNG